MIPEPIEAAQRGNLAALTEGDLSPAWAAVADALRCLASRDAVERPRAEDLCAGLEGVGGARALELLGVRALLALDRVALESTIHALLGFGVHGAAAYNHLSGWLAFLRGQGEIAQKLGEQLESDSRARGKSTGVVEGAVLNAAGILLGGDPSAALKQVRRAARMAQSERLWTSNFLAGILLSRARRMNGQTYLAARVAVACLAVTGSEWAPLLEWELFFAGGDTSHAHRELPIVRVRAELAEWLLGDGQVPRRTALGSVPHEGDIAAALFAAGASEETSEAATSKWIYGNAQDVPGIISGISAHASQHGPVRIIVRSNAKARRMLHTVPKGVTPLPPSGVEATRVEALVAVLAFADGPLSRRTLFERTYGFKYRPEIHEDAFKVLRSQAKSFIAGWATLGSVDGYVLHVHKDIAVLDPGSKQPTGNAILGRLGQMGQSNAKSLAETLGIPLRTVQAALKELVNDGACEVQRIGRRVEYVVEDTTFQEITLT
ncbi:MAG: hypothetical protein AB8H86_13510 [Polyangiales bacterium]